MGVFARIRSSSRLAGTDLPCCKCWADGGVGMYLPPAYVLYTRTKDDERACKVVGACRSPGSLVCLHVTCCSLSQS